MDSGEIGNIVRKVCKDVFIGVYARDQLPINILRRPALLVANTDPANQPGTHWIAMYFDTDGTGEYFDSLAQTVHKTFTDYMEEHCLSWIANERQLQSVVSRFCGHYSIAYCAFRFLGYNINSICSMFSRDYGLNDVMVHEFVCRRNK
jgi:hypothetical protein